MAGMQERPHLMPMLESSFNNGCIFVEAFFGHNYTQCNCGKNVMIFTPQLMTKIITMKFQGDFTVAETAQLATLFANMCLCSAPGGEEKRKWLAFADFCRNQSV
jgi:hypothetical protein